jgi:hypothetical protein
MTTADLLRSARAKYAAKPSHAPADQYPDDGECPITALTHVCMTWGNDFRFCRRAESALERTIGTHDIPAWNAEHSTEDVLAAFDRAIELAEGGS